MLQIQALGPLNVIGQAGRQVPLAAGEKRLALFLFLLLDGRGGFIRRDLLLPLLWPEADDPHARSALRSLIRDVRNAVGDGVVLSDGDHTLAVDATRVRCDVLEFEQACRDGHWERAVEEYRGPFLQGFGVSGAPGFEEWLERERNRLATLALDACRELAREGRARGAHDTVVRALRKALRISPYDERAVQELMQALDAAGDRAGALMAYEEFAARVEKELEVKPGAKTVAVAQAVRTNQTHAPVPPGQGPFEPGVVPFPVRRGPRRRILSVALVIGVVATVGGWLVFGRGGAAAPPIQSLVVLPFENLSGDPEQEYFVQGMHEAVIGDLARIGDLKVISRNSAMRYQHSGKSVQAITRELDVDAILEGSVLRAGDRVRVTLQLIEGRKDRHLWARTYDRELRDVLGLQAEVARAVGREIAVAVRPADSDGLDAASQTASRLRPSPEAYDAFLKGRYHFTRYGVEDFRTAMRYYEEAIVQDPEFAAAHAALAEVLLRPVVNDLERASVAARLAVALDPALAEGHAALGMVRMEEWDWAGAEVAFQRALDLNPNSSTAHYAYAQLLRVTMRKDEALREASRAAELDPFWPFAKTMVGWVLFDQRRFDEAIELWDEVLEVDPGYELAIYDKGLAYAMQGRGEEVVTAARRLEAMQGRTPEGVVTWLLGLGLAVSGRGDSAAEIVHAFDGRMAPGALAYIEHILGDDRAALDLLERGYDARSRFLPENTSLPWFDDLRDDPRFRALRAKMGLP